MSGKIDLIGKRGHRGSALWDSEKTAAVGKGTLRVAGQVYVITSLKARPLAASCQPGCEWAWVLRGGEDVWELRTRC